MSAMVSVYFAGMRCLIAPVWALGSQVRRWEKPMTSPDDIRYTKIALNHGAGSMPALGFGTLIPDPVATRNATKAALEAGFRLLDTAERYQTEREVGDAMQEVFRAGNLKREDVFVTTKLWNTNHRPERVRPAF